MRSISNGRADLLRGFCRCFLFVLPGPKSVYPENQKPGRKPDHIPPQLIMLKIVLRKIVSETENGCGNCAMANSCAGKDKEAANG